MSFNQSEQKWAGNKRNQEFVPVNVENDYRRKKSNNEQTLVERLKIRQNRIRRWFDVGVRPVAR